MASRLRISQFSLNNKQYIISVAFTNKHLLFIHMSIAQLNLANLSWSPSSGLDSKLWDGSKSFLHVSLTLSYWTPKHEFSQSKAGGQVCKPTCTSIYQALVHLLSVNILLQNSSWPIAKPNINR